MAPESLSKQRCLLGLDLSATTDLTALVAVFPDKRSEYFDVLGFVWAAANLESARCWTACHKVRVDKARAKQVIQAPTGCLQ